MNWFKKKPSVEEVVAEAVSAALKLERDEATRQRARDAKKQEEEAARIEAARIEEAEKAKSDAIDAAGQEPLLRVVITAKINEAGNLEAVYDVESNDAGIQMIDRSYEGPRWNKLRSDQEKITLFLYDAVSSLAEPILPDATVTELDLRREVFDSPGQAQPFVTTEVDITGATRYGQG